MSDSREERSCFVTARQSRQAAFWGILTLTAFLPLNLIVYKVNLGRHFLVNGLNLKLAVVFGKTTAQDPNDKSEFSNLQLPFHYTADNSTVVAVQ